jgi:hypothetical protein
MIGDFCLKRGFVLTEIEQELKYFTSQDVYFLEELYTRQYVENFLYGNNFSEGLNKLDALEKPYFIQQFIHHFKLELFWAIFPTLKCIAILIPSIALLYSTASVKFFDFSQHVTGNQ